MNYTECSAYFAIMDINFPCLDNSLLDSIWLLDIPLKVSGLDCVGWVFGRLECDNWLDFVSLGYSAFIGPYASKCDLTNSRDEGPLRWCRDRGKLSLSLVLTAVMRSNGAKDQGQMGKSKEKRKKKS
ncbi:hypothetical protein JHK87_010257 [Glycine soja]|nr:hypothetical protein JHK87_010257 [Glycine soja]